MNKHGTRRTRLITALSALALACGMLGLGTGAAGAATTHARFPGAFAPTATAPLEVSGLAPPAPRRPGRASVRPLTCTPQHYPFRFSSGTSWVAPSSGSYTKDADGCQSVWLTTGQTFYVVLYAANGTTIGTWCYAGETCQVWPNAAILVKFQIVDYTETPTSVNIYF
jgi:hypothetical protein